MLLTLATACGLGLGWASSTRADGYHFHKTVPRLVPAYDYTTGGEYNGLLQVWGDPDVGPPSVRASAWVFIRHGAVFLGTGNASAGPDTQTDVIGQWVQLTALNSTCPANQTAIFAVGKEGADYDVDSPVVIVNPGGFCAPP